VAEWNPFSSVRELGYGGCRVGRNTVCAGGLIRVTINSILSKPNFKALHTKIQKFSTKKRIHQTKMKKIFKLLKDLLAAKACALLLK